MQRLMTLWTAVVVLALLSSCSKRPSGMGAATPSRGHQLNATAEREMPDPGDERLVAQILHSPLRSAGSRGGPYVIVVHSELTRAIVARGAAIEPLLIRRIEESRDAHELTTCVFCLHEMRSERALGAIRKLAADMQSGGRTLSTGRDMTLEMEIASYWEDFAASPQAQEPDDPK